MLLGRSPFDSASGVSADLLPVLNSTYNLGSSTSRFKSLYLSEDMHVSGDFYLIGNLEISGDIDSAGGAGFAESVIFSAATAGIQLKSGANGRTGTFTLNGATPVVVNNTSLAAGDQIVITRDVPAGTPGVWNLTARTDGASFAVTGTALDTSVMRYSLIRIA